MRTFIRAVEVWVPAPDGTMLELSDGLYGDALNFARLSRTMCFGRGEGLPGRTWEAGKPILLKHFEGSYFRRTVAAHAAGLTGALAVPVYQGERITAIAMFFFGDDGAQAGSVEVWHNDPRISTDMTLADGYFGPAAQNLAQASSDTYLPKGTGLPGMAWKQGGPVFMKEVSDRSRFLRAEEAVDAGLVRGWAWPSGTASDEVTALVMLSTPELPTALAVEAWQRDGEQVNRRLAYAEGQPADADGAGGLSLPLAGGGAIAAALSSGVPQCAAVAGSEPGAVGALAKAVGATSLFALPVSLDGDVQDVLAFYL